MYEQSQLLVSRIREDESINDGEDWKLITIFIGGNDLCSACDNTHHYSAEQYVENIKKAIDYLYNEVNETGHDTFYRNRTSLKRNTKIAIIETF